MRKLQLEQLNRLDLDAYKKIPKYPLIVALDNIRSGHNVGSAFRTCDAFLVEELILSGFTPQPPHKEIFKTAIGATESVNWYYTNELADELRRIKMAKPKTQIIGIEQTDQSISLESFEPDTNANYILVFGNEVQGISDEVLPILDAAIEVPQFGTKHSLNVSVCLGIVLWQFVQFYLPTK